MVVTHLIILWYCPTCGQVWGAAQLQKTEGLSRLDTLRYLAAESMCLADLARELSHERRTARLERFSSKALEARAQKTRVYHELVANYVLAVKWTLRSTRRRVSPSSPAPDSELSAA
jgi:hypothetical protein